MEYNDIDLSRRHGIVQCCAENSENGDIVLDTCLPKGIHKCVKSLCTDGQCLLRALQFFLGALDSPFSFKMDEIEDSTQSQQKAAYVKQKRTSEMNSKYLYMIHKITKIMEEHSRRIRTQECYSVKHRKLLIVMTMRVNNLVANTLGDQACETKQTNDTMSVKACAGNSKLVRLYLYDNEPPARKPLVSNSTHQNTADVEKMKTVFLCENSDCVLSDELFRKYFYDVLNVLSNELSRKYFHNVLNVLFGKLPWKYVHDVQNAVSGKLPGKYVHDAQSVISDELSGKYLCNAENILSGKLFEKNVDKVFSVPRQGSFWHRSDSTGDILRNVLWNLSNKSCVKLCKNVLQNGLPTDESVKSCKNVLQNDLSADEIYKSSKNGLLNDVPTDECVKSYKKGLYNSLSTVKCDKGCKNFLQNNLSADEFDKSRKSFLQNDMFASKCDKSCENFLQNDLSADEFDKSCKNVLQNDMSASKCDKSCKNSLQNDLPTDESVKSCNSGLCNDLPSAEADKRCNSTLGNDLSRESSADFDSSALYNDKVSENIVDIKRLPHSVSCRSFKGYNDFVIKVTGIGKLRLCHSLYLGLMDHTKAGGNVGKWSKSGVSSKLSKKSCVSGKLPKSSVNDKWLKSCISHKWSKSCVRDKWSKSCVKDKWYRSCVSDKWSKSCVKDKWSRSCVSDKWSKSCVSDKWSRSCVSDQLQADVLRSSGIYPRFSLILPTILQEVQLYPLIRGDPIENTSQGDLYHLMSYEAFRLSSFSYARFPASVDVWVTQLAQAGFYCEDEHGRIVCFHCRQEFRGQAGSHIENFHHLGCNYQQHSRPLHVWTEGLNQEVLTVYYNRYGSLRPYNFEASDQNGWTDHTDRPHEVLGRSAVIEHRTPPLNEQVLGSASVGREFPTPVLAEEARADSAAEDADPRHHSETHPVELSETRHDQASANRPQSLASNHDGNLSRGAIVIEESENSSGSCQVLTSAARNPMPLHSTAVRGEQSYANDGHDLGAVGGAGATLDLSKASYPLFSSPEARRNSFSAWSPAHSHRPEDLVAGGFFYAGYADCVRCFYCGLGLKFWRPTDIPAYQHARYRPNCVYNRLYKGQDYIDRVLQDLSEQGATNQAADEARPPAGGEVVTAPPAGEIPQAPDLMNSEAAQEALRNGWEVVQVQQAIDHIVREFGANSLEVSLLLDVLVNLNMENLDRNLPSGDSIESIDSGITDIGVLRGAADPQHRGPPLPLVADVDDAAGEEYNAPPEARAEELPPRPPVEIGELLRSVEREHALLAERTLCRLCRRQTVSCIYLPCGHVVACQECADNATHCFLCAREIIGTANIYLA